MKSDIDNWVAFLNEATSKANNNNVSFDEQNVSRDLKMIAIPMLKKFIGDIKGRHLTNLLLHLEKSFQIVCKQLKNDMTLDDLRKLSFLALSNVVVEILREMRVEAYSTGKDFDPVEFLNFYENDIAQEDIDIQEDSDDDSEYIQEDTDDEVDDSEYEPEYLMNEDNEELLIDIIKKNQQKRNYLSVNGNNNTRNKKQKLDMEFMNSLNTTLVPKSYEGQAFSHFTKFDDEKKKAFLQKFNTVVETNSNEEPVLFKIVNMDLPADQKNNILSEYMNIENCMSDKSKLKTWLDNVLKLPFGREKGINISTLKDPVKVKEFIEQLNDKMNESVWGHDEAKKKIVEIMVQYITNPKSKGNCLGIWGPPGNGKTTLIKEGIAKAMDRSFVFISLGGASDASFLEGHSYTYEGSIYGRIAQGLMKCESMNPIIYFDELDKISNTPKGQEITNLLVHLTDPAQNSEFVDKYFYNIKIDLSKVTFIFSYNDPSLVDPVLRDRITQVETKYLLMNQKINIAKKYLLPDILKDVGLSVDSIDISDNELSQIISKYTMEGGVRKLKSIFYSIVRQLNILALTNGTVCKTPVTWPFKITRDTMGELLKDYNEINFQKIHKYSTVGLINGMWAGRLGIGGVLPIESSWIPAQNRNYIKTTGSLEKVIKESIEVANTLAWTFIDKTVKKKFEEDFKNTPYGIHIHCPEGGISKDGPSAGTALTVLFYSLYMNKKIRNDIAITGEISLQGNVLEIGGLEEKLQGAKKAGIKLAIIPKPNLKDMIKINERNPKLIDSTFNVMAVETIDEVLKTVFV
jgi:endopeptidase La